MAKNIGVDPIHDTVKEGPAGLIARLESARHIPQRSTDQLKVEGLHALASIDTNNVELRETSNRGNVRALIYPSGRAFLSYLYDTPFFNAIDELTQYGSLNIRGKHDIHHLNNVHLSMFVGFYQGALVTLTNDTRVQNNMLSLMRQMLVFWPTSGTRRFTRVGQIDVALHRVQQVAMHGVEALQELSTGALMIPDYLDRATESYVHPGVGVRYTILNRQQRIARIAVAVAFWRIASGGGFEIEKSDLAVADAILHLHEMGGRLMELSMSKGKLGHEFMRIFVALLQGEDVQPGEELSHASELNIGATALGRLGEMSVLTDEHKLFDEYRYVTGNTIRAHKKRWELNEKGIS